MRDIHPAQGTRPGTPPHRDASWIPSGKPFRHGINANKGIFTHGVHGGANVLRMRCPNDPVTAAQIMRHS